MKRADVIVIGGGIAGVSAAAELAEAMQVVLLESEPQAGYHSSGRSAAYFASAYGNEAVRGITAASESFYLRPPVDFCEHSLIRPRDCLFVAREDQLEHFSEMKHAVPELLSCDANQVLNHVPILKPAYAAAGLLDSRGGDLDADASLQGYMRWFRRRGGEFVGGSEVNALSYKNACWTVRCADAEYSAPLVINAAGAWADTIAQLAGLDALGITPKRRSVLLIDAPRGHDINSLPLTIDIEEQFYFKPDAGQLLVSPANEDPSLACDAQPDEMDIAIAVDRFMSATEVEVRRINHSWAGLRSFAPDKTFVVGFDPRCEGFFWLAGQGGYGIQSAPGLAQLTAHQIAGRSLNGDFKTLVNYSDAVRPDRLIQ